MDWEEQHWALGMPADCAKPWNIVLFVFSCSSGCCAVGSPSHLFMALMQKIVMAVIASDLLIAHSPSLLGWRQKTSISFQGLKLCHPNGQGGEGGYLCICLKSIWM